MKHISEKFHFKKIKSFSKEQSNNIDLFHRLYSDRQIESSFAGTDH
jgi:hypothetical protein